MNKKFLVFVLGGCFAMASCSDSKNKAAEASKAALESMESSESGAKNEEPVAPQETVSEVVEVSVPVMEADSAVAIVDVVQESESDVKEDIAEGVDEFAQNADNSQGGEEALSEDLTALSEKMGFLVTENDDLELFQEVVSWLGAPYLAAGNDKSGVDCSGFICKVFEKIYSKKLPRRSTDMYDQCETIPISDAKAGDLVFFRPDGKMNEKPNYVGVYLKNDSFVIVSSSKGVTIADLSTNYYKKTFVSAGRLRN